MALVYFTFRLRQTLVGLFLLMNVASLLAAPVLSDSASRLIPTNDSPSLPTLFACSAPYDPITYSITAIAASIDWTATGFTSFTYRYKPTSSSTWTTVSTTQYGLITLTGLTPTTSYEWQVQQTCTDNSVSAFTTSTTFTTGECTAPTSPITYNITTTSARLRWFDNQRTNNYTVQYRVVGAGAWTTIPNIPGNGPASNPNTSSTITYDLTGLANNTDYEWAVLRACTGTVLSQYTATQTFTTSCSTPSFAGVVSGSVQYDRATLNWNSFGTGTTYTIQYKAGLTGTFQTITGIPSTTGVAANTGYLLTGLANNTTYYFQVQTNCAGGVSSAYSELSNFTTQCNSPGLSSVNASWNSAEVQWYDQINEPTTTQYILNYQPVSSGSSTTLTNVTSPYTLTGLGTNVAYSVKVQAVCAPGITSAYSPSQSFTTSCGTINSNYSSTNNVGSRSARLEWYDPDNTATYEVQYRTVSPVSGTFQSVTNITGGTNEYKTYSLTGLANSTAYEWKVRKICGALTSPAFTTPLSFTTALCTTPGSPEGITADITTSTARVAWSTIEFGTPHELQYRVNGTTTWQSIPGISRTSSPYNYTLTGLTSNTTYNTRVRAVCSTTATSPFSSVSSFTTKSCALPTSMSALNITTTSAQLSWAGTPGNTYELQYRSTGGTYTTLSVGAATSYTLTGLTIQTTYEWRVRTICDGGNSTSGYPAQPLTFQTSSTSCTGMFTTQAGDWHNPAIWSCGRIPNSTDTVQVGHVVTLQNGSMGNAHNVTFIANGKINFGTGARIIQTP